MKMQETPLDWLTLTTTLAQSEEPHIADAGEQMQLDLMRWADDGGFIPTNSAA